MEQRLEEIYQLLSNKLEQNEANIRREIKSETAYMKKVLAEMQVKQQQMAEIISVQKQEITFLKKEINKNNIIIHGIQEPPNEKSLEKNIVEVLKEKLNITTPDATILDCYRLGKGKPNCPIKMCLNGAKIKEEIMKNKNKLRNTEIYINHDLPKEIRILNAEKRKREKESREKTGDEPLIITPAESNK